MAKIYKTVVLSLFFFTSVMLYFYGKRNGYIMAIQVLEDNNLQDAYDYIATLATDSTQTIALDTIKNIHNKIYRSLKILYSYSSSYILFPRHYGLCNAGEWRTGNHDSIRPFADFTRISELMNEFIIWLHSSSIEDPIRLAAEAHVKLLKIHPFWDGNGRTARALMNLILLQADYEPITITPEDRNLYSESMIKTVHENNLIYFYNFILKRTKKISSA